jgi:hypothetical protein
MVPSDATGGTEVFPSDCMPLRQTGVDEAVPASDIEYTDPLPSPTSPTALLDRFQLAGQTIFSTSEAPNSRSPICLFGVGDFHLEMIVNTRNGGLEYPRIGGKPVIRPFLLLRASIPELARDRAHLWIFARSRGRI